MIVKILKKSATFKGVSYNTGKVEKDKGELMLVKNFGALQGLEQLRPKDYINYLAAVSARSARTKYPQLHVVISGKGKSHSKEELMDIAQLWLQGMGYGEQPYLLIFHKDTQNNHIHLVSTRVGKDGKKISDSYEKLRAYQVLNRITGEDIKQAVTNHLEKAHSYGISTRAQFMMILEAQGYALTLTGGQYSISKYGRELARTDLAKVDAQIAARQKDTGRVRQIRAIIEKYRTKYDPAIYPLTRELPGGTASVITGYSSRLSEFLQEKFGIQVLFHAKDNKPAYGFTLIDHTGKAVYKGGEIMTLAAFIAPVPGISDAPVESVWIGSVDPGDAGLKPDEQIPEAATGETSQAFDAPIYPGTGIDLPELSLDIADDIDDEAILGRNRQRKRKARTNTR